MDKPVTIIAGLGRCGSSLLMQMLHAVGYPVTGLYPAFEDDRAGIASFNPDWLINQGGKAVKILTADCKDINIPQGLSTRTIWIDRDRKEQAKSAGKFLAMMCGISITRADIKALESAAKSSRRAAIDKLIPHGPMLQITFEGLINRNEKTIQGVCDFLDLPTGSMEHMKAVILPRSSKCANGLDIEISLMQERAEG